MRCSTLLPYIIIYLTHGLDSKRAAYGHK